MNFFITFLLLLTIKNISNFLNVSDCTPAYYFDTAQMNCTSCTDQQNPEDEKECVCKYNYKTTEGWIGFKGATPCAACLANQVHTFDEMRCASCPTTIDTTTEDCTCTGDSTTYAVVDVEQTGEQLTTKKCVTCNKNALPGIRDFSNEWGCEPCGPQKYNLKGVCICKDGFSAAGDICISSDLITTYLATYDLDSAIKVAYYKIQESGSTVSTEIVSDTFKYYYYKVRDINYFIFISISQSAIGCLKDQNQESCQALAHLCVLQLYSESTVVCSLFKTKSELAASLSALLEFYLKLVINIYIVQDGGKISHFYTINLHMNRLWIQQIQKQR